MKKIKPKLFPHPSKELFILKARQKEGQLQSVICLLYCHQNS